MSGLLSANVPGQEFDVGVIRAARPDLLPPTTKKGVDCQLPPADFVENVDEPEEFLCGCNLPARTLDTQKPYGTCPCPPTVLCNSNPLARHPARWQVSWRLRHQPSCPNSHRGGILFSCPDGGYRSEARASQAHPQARTQLLDSASDDQRGGHGSRFRTWKTWWRACLVSL